MASHAEARKVQWDREQDNPETRDNSPSPSVAADPGRHEAWQSAARLADGAAGRVQTAASTPRRTLDQGEQAVKYGWHMMAEAQGPLADAGFNQGQRLLQTATHVSDIYRDAAERTSGDLHILATSYATLGRGFQQWQHTCFDLLNQSMDRMKNRPQQLLRCRTMSEFAEVQRELYTDMIDGMLTSSTTLLQLTGQITQDAARPLRERAQRAA